MTLVLGKARSRRVPNLGCRGPESPERFDVIPKYSVRNVMHERAHCCNEAANHHLPITAAVVILLNLSTDEEH